VDASQLPDLFDEKALKVGDQYNQELAFQLCRSACMVMFFSPLHFDVQHPYCALEYQAVLDLERQRLGTAEADLRNKGSIFRSSSVDQIAFHPRSLAPATTKISTRAFECGRLGWRCRTTQGLGRTRRRDRTVRLGRRVHAELYLAPGYQNVDRTTARPVAVGDGPIDFPVLQARQIDGVTRSWPSGQAWVSFGDSPLKLSRGETLRVFPKWEGW
jgi:hypothetical protein